MRRRLHHRSARVIPLEVPASGALFEGHFPGRPILPGIGLLDLALRALGPMAGDGALLGIEHWKWRSIVAPGERLAFVANLPAPDGAIRLELRRGTEVVAGGALTLGDPDCRAPIDVASAGPASAGTAPFAATGAGAGPGAASAGVPALDRLLPHGEPMRFVSAVETEPDDGIVCAASVPTGSPFARDGTAPAFVAIEMAAQAAAVFEALRRFRAPGGEPGRDFDRVGGAGPRIGYLVGARGVRFLAARVAAGADCRVAIRLAGLAGPLSSYRFEVARAGDPVAAGTVSTWITATAV